MVGAQQRCTPLVLRDPPVKVKPMAEGRNATPRERKSHSREGRASAVPPGILSHVPPTAMLGAEGAWLCSIDHHRSLAPIAFPNTQECDSPTAA